MLLLPIWQQKLGIGDRSGEYFRNTKWNRKQICLYANEPTPVSQLCVCYPTETHMWQICVYELGIPGFGLWKLKKPEFSLPVLTGSMNCALISHQNCCHCTSAASLKHFFLFADPKKSTCKYLELQGSPLNVNWLAVDLCYFSPISMN